MRAIAECVPNFSEGRRPEVTEAIVAVYQNRAGVTILDASADPDHNRLVISLVGELAALSVATFDAVRRASELIDLTTHAGSHPRMGATDVIPFVPITGVSMEQCVAEARRLAQRIAEELGIPTYLYEEAAVRQDRRNLEDIRRGQFEGLLTEIERPERHPDFGPARLHPTAGATVVGARQPLIAYNVLLNTPDVDIAKAIAKALRARDGGLAFIKAIGVKVEDRGVCQVSMNVTNFRKTPMYRAIELVRVEARRYGVSVVGSEVVGMIPAEALVQCARYYLGLEKFRADQIIENRMGDNG